MNCNGFMAIIFAVHTCIYVSIIWMDHLQYYVFFNREYFSPIRMMGE